ncbi:MAG: hypothetical protein D6743_02535, partial [Calditrichaeota bacterium]
TPNDAANTITISSSASGSDSDWILSGSNMYSGVSGNVGIGVTNPTYKLVSQDDANNGTGVQGVANNGSEAYGVWGYSTGGKGVVGTAQSGTGVMGQVYSTGSAVYGTAPTSEFAWAGKFDGNVKVTGNVQIIGNLSKSSGSFKIDHPLDPANKYLYHSFVESPDMMNIYNGNVTLDANGEAWVQLPEWFEALNRDFRYQLTAIGAPGPNLYVAEEISGNRFKIAGGRPGMKVSWQVTGIRHDAFAEAHRIPVEEMKPPRERGYYLHPVELGQPEERGIEWAIRPEAMRAIKEMQKQPFRPDRKPIDPLQPKQ